MAKRPLRQRDEPSPKGLLAEKPGRIPVCNRCGQVFTADDTGVGRLAGYFGRVVYSCACGTKYSVDVQGIRTEG